MSHPLVMFHCPEYKTTERSFSSAVQRHPVITIHKVIHSSLKHAMCTNTREELC